MVPRHKPVFPVLYVAGRTSGRLRNLPFRTTSVSGLRRVPIAVRGYVYHDITYIWVRLIQVDPLTRDRRYCLATVFGDPHVITFDDLEYTFNGKGEFVLVHVESEKYKFDVQGRFEQLPDNIYGPVRATSLTSVVSRDNTSTVIEVRLRPPAAQWRYRLDVFADGKRVYFDRPALKVQHFHGKRDRRPSACTTLRR